MARKTKADIVEENKIYVSEQMERFLWKNYKLTLEGVDVFIDRDTEYKRVMSKLEFNENNEFEGIVISYYLLQQSKTKILERAFHECIHYALYKKGLPFQDGSPYFENELKKHGLEYTSTGGLTEGWADLHTYTCTKCKKIKFMKKDRIPKSKCPEFNEYLTGCCRSKFKYKGKIRYSNKKLQELRSKVKRKEEIKNKG